MKTKMHLALHAAVAVSLFSLPAYGDVISSRTVLNSILGSSGVTEDFEHLTVDANDQYDPDSETTLDSTTLATIYGSPVGGPGLVIPGVQFVSSQQLAWNGDSYFGLSTNTLLSNSSDSTLEVLFTQPVNAFGLDLLAFQGYGDIADVAVFGPDQSTVIYSSQDVTLPDSAAAVFFGYGDAGGIGGALITQQNNPWSPVIDNVTFGEATGAEAPEPSGWSLAGFGLLLLFAGSRARNQQRA